MAENKFIKHLKGEQTAGSLVEIKNQNTPASFGNMPQGTSDSNVKYSDVRGDVTVVANGTTAWKLNDSALTLAPIVNGDGTDYTGKYEVSGAGLWVNSTYTFPSTGDPNHPVAMIFNPNSKWVLKLCGDNLIVNNGETLELNVIITIGTSNIISKQFTIKEQANQFCKELVIDFDESNASMIKASGLATLQLQVLCGTADASARIYNGMTTLTVLQRKVDAAVVSGTFANVEEVMRDGLLPNDYFSNAAYIAQITDGDTAYAVFQRDGDDVALAGWAQPIPDQTNNAGKFLTTDGSLMSWAQLTISNIDGLSTELGDLQDQIDDLSGRGRYLSIWNCTTGLAETNPPTSPYMYQSGDYFVVGTVGATNYRPDGSSYTTGVASTTVETAEVKVDDVYLYDGTNWKLLASSQRTYTFAGIAGSPYDNTNLSSALNLKADASALTAHTSNTNNPHSVTKAQVGLGNVDNTADLDKPISTATQSALNGKQNTISDLSEIRSGAALGTTAVQPGDLATVATSGSYNDLSDKPTIPAAQVNSDWNANSGVAQILNKPTLATVATSGSYNDLSDKPTIPTVNNATLTIQKNGTTVQTFTANQSTNATANISVPTKTSDITNDSGFITSSALAPYALSADLATVATSGSYNDLSDKPTIPTVNNSTITITQGGVTKGSFTLNQATGDTIALDAGGSGSGYHPDLFDVKWADHILNDVQWLRADTYSWQSGAVYQVAYQHLEDDIDGKTLQSETVAGTTIQFYLANDGHKICPASEESNVSAIYNATGVAWYYIIDTANTRFKLPRSKHNKYAETLGVVGNGITLGLTDGTGTGGLNSARIGSVDGTFWSNTGSYGQPIGVANSGSIISNNKSLGITTDPTKSGIIAQQEQDTDQYKYLYFYVGNFTQTALENTAGLNAELFNGKADLNLENTVPTSTFAQLLLNAGIDTVVESQDPTAENNYTWYRKYASGFVQQGGKLTQSGTATLPVEMSDNNYNLQVRLDYNNTGTIQGRYWYATKTTTGFTMAAFLPLDWLVCGKAA